MLSASVPAQRFVCACGPATPLDMMKLGSAEGFGFWGLGFSVWTLGVLKAVSGLLFFPHGLSVCAPLAQVRAFLPT